MSNEDNWLLQTIVAKSDQLNAVDLVGGAQTYTVAKVSKCEGDQPVAIDIGDSKRPYKPCKSMRRVLIACWGANPAMWIGRQMTLFCDSSVKWGGESVGGIRISHLSHLDDATKEIQLNESKHKKTTYKVFRIEQDIQGRFSKALNAIRNAADVKALEKTWKLCEQVYKECSADLQTQLEAARNEKMEAFNV